MVSGCLGLVITLAGVLFTLFPSCCLWPCGPLGWGIGVAWDNLINSITQFFLQCVGIISVL